MKALIQRTFLNENTKYLITNLARNPFLTNNRLLINHISSNSNYSFLSVPKTSFFWINNKINPAVKKSLENLYSNNIINLSKKSFSRNSTQWLDRHTNDVYVKKSVEVQ